MSLWYVRATIHGDTPGSEGASVNPCPGKLGATTVYPGEYYAIIRLTGQW